VCDLDPGEIVMYIKILVSKKVRLDPDEIVMYYVLIILRNNTTLTGLCLREYVSLRYLVESPSREIEWYHSDFNILH
jgi:hypothetical protein